MKKVFLYIMIALGSFSLSNCDNDELVLGKSELDADRELMTMFRVDNNTNKGDTDPYRCQVVNINDVHLRWYGVDGCAGYEVKWGLQGNVSSGLAEDWENPANIVGSVVLGPEELEYVVKDLQYATPYMFAIRTLSKRGEAYHSKWYGYGSGRQWSEYVGFTTEPRYDTPEVIVVSNITKETFRVNIDRSLANSGSADLQAKYQNNFEITNGNFVMQKLIVAPSPTNPDASCPDKWRNYTLTEEDFNRGYVDIDGLQTNCVYTVDVKNENVPVQWDAIYNTCVIRMDGIVGEPILIEHFADPNDTIKGAYDYKACRLDTIIDNYTANGDLAEGQIFYLEGGKTYYFAQNVSICKGFTLQTDPETLANGRAKVLMGGTYSMDNGDCGNSMNFMFGRNPQVGELGGINVKSVVFKDLDFDCPTAIYYNKYTKNGTGNYFANMYSMGMAVSFQSFEIYDCTFQGQIRGFLRTQGPNRKTFERIQIENCIFYNSVDYQNSGGGYNWFHGDGALAKCNVFNDFIFRNNTIYDSPHGSFITNNKDNFDWPVNIAYHFTIENNTFINFETQGGAKIFDMRNVPSGTTIKFQKNLFIMTKDPSDKRSMKSQAIDLRKVNGSGVITYDFKDNYSTNVFYTNEGEIRTNGSIFTSGFNASKNNAGYNFNISGTEELEMHLGDAQDPEGISPTELMRNPNPPNHDGSPLKHRGINLDNLYYNNTDKVRNSAIYRLGIGDPRWRQMK